MRIPNVTPAWRGRWFRWLSIAALAVCSPAGADTYKLRAGQEVFRIHLPQGYREIEPGTYSAREEPFAIEVVAYAPVATPMEEAAQRLIDGFRLACRDARRGHPGEFAASKDAVDVDIGIRGVCRMGDGSVNVVKARVWARDGHTFAKSVRLESFPMPGKTQPLLPMLERASAILDQVSYTSP